MNALIKIRDVAAKYDVSARTLRYHDGMGLMLWEKTLKTNFYML